MVWFSSPLSLSLRGCFSLSCLRWLLLVLLLLVFYVVVHCLSFSLCGGGTRKPPAPQMRERGGHSPERAAHYTERGLRKSTFVLSFCADSMFPYLSPCGGSSSLSFFCGWFLTPLSLFLDGLCVSFYIDERTKHHHHNRTREEEDGATNTEKLKRRCFSSIFCGSLSLLWWLHSSFFRCFFFLCETAHIDLYTFVTSLPSAGLCLHFPLLSPVTVLFFVRGCV